MCEALLALELMLTLTLTVQGRFRILLEKQNGAREKSRNRAKVKLVKNMINEADR